LHWVPASAGTTQRCSQTDAHWMFDGRFRQSSPVGATRVAKVRSSATLCGPFAERVASQPFAACAAPTEECSAAHSREANKRRCHRRRFRPASGRAVAQLTQKGLFLRYSRASGNPVRHYRSPGSRLRGNDGKVFLNRCLLDVRWKRPPALPCGSDACREGALQRDTLRALRRRGRFATLRGLRRSHRRVPCSALTRSNQASVPPKEIPPRLRQRAVAPLTASTLAPAEPPKKRSVALY
jgi:hypothetical protein